MKVVILAGGFGTRMSEYTKTIPKPMVKINGLPMIVHIMKHYSSYGFNDFYIAYGYKGKIIKDYFKDHRIFMMTAIAALTFGGNWKIANANSISTSFPTFLKIIKKLGGEIK